MTNHEEKQLQFYNGFYKSRTQNIEFSPVHIWFKDLLDRFIPLMDTKKIHSILDVGSGDGVCTLFLSRLFPESLTVGLDMSDSAIEFAVNNFKSENLTFKLGNANDVEPGKYDLVSCFEVLEHLEYWEDALNGIINMKPRYILISVPTGKMYEFEKRYGHIRHFNGEIDEFLVCHGYNPLKVINAGFPFYRFFYIWLTRFDFLFDINAQIMKRKRNALQKIYTGVIYFLLRYLSIQEKRGAQYMGLFEINK